ncbi:MAG TPA: GUN4 domain-containing protein [Trichormus sp. M33_DOE_039]|nr:GUN4 domain-containing protein [Trichormus sp. M33_DOE_039]
MFKPDNSQFTTPLSYYEKAIEELRRSREELQELKAIYLQNMNSNFQDLCTEIKELKRELQITKDTVKKSEKQGLETQTRLKEISQLVEKLFIASTVNGMDYSKLESLLKEQKWQEADQETYSVILKICGHQKGRWLVDKEIQKLSAQDFRNINDL